MRLFEQNSQFAKILIKRDQNATFTMRNGQDFLITRIFVPISRPNDIVTCGFQYPQCSTPNTGIQQNFHAAVPMTNNSTRS